MWSGVIMSALSTSGYIFRVHVDVARALAHALHRRLGDELREVGACVAVRVVGNVDEVDLCREAHPLRFLRQDLQPTGRIRDAQVDLTVEAAKAAQRRVEDGGAVGCSDHDDVAGGLDTVHEGEQLRDDAPLHFALRLLALGGDRIDLVNEDDGGRVRLGVREDLA